MNDRQFGWVEPTAKSSGMSNMVGSRLITNQHPVGVNGRAKRVALVRLHIEKAHLPGLWQSFLGTLLRG
jgi:hypothetical protein